MAAPSAGNRRMSERDLTRMGSDGRGGLGNGPLVPGGSGHLPNSKSVPALHHHTGSGTILCKLFTLFRINVVLN